MLIGPLWLLQYATSDGAPLAHNLGIISGFIVLFTVSSVSGFGHTELTHD